MSEILGYEKSKCQVNISPKCRRTEAGYLRRLRFAQEGPWLDACEMCARVPYEQPAQFQKTEEDITRGF
jgi:hypothetical protein